MKLRSAFEDFKQNTLGALPHLWEKLEFVASIRSATGKYTHWGLSQCYGESEAETAIAAAHRELFIQALSTPIQDLWTDASASELSNGAAFTDCVETLQRDARLFPIDTGGGPREHLDLILHLFSLLSRSRQRSIDRSA